MKPSNPRDARGEPLLGDTLILLLAALLHTASLAWPLTNPALQFAAQGLVAGHSVGWLNLVALALLAHIVLYHNSARAIALRAGWFAACVLASSWWWLYISMHTYGGLAAPLAALAVVALASSVALLYAIAFAVYGWVVRALPPSPMGQALRVIAFACTWLLAELARGNFFTGLPWGASGYAHVDGALGKLAPWVGVYGLSALAALLGACLALAYRQGQFKWRPIALFGGVMLALTMVPRPSFTEPAGSLAVTLLQGNIPQNEKFQPSGGVPIALNWYQNQLLAATTPLVLVPETGLPLLPQHLPIGYLETLQTHFGKAPATGEPGRLALVGIPMGNRQQGYANSVMGLGAPGPNGSDYRYNKHHLVPFGEYVPPLFRWFTDLLQIPLANFSESTAMQAPVDFAGQRIAPNICYEDLFGEEMAVLYTRADQAPTLMANFSNIAWFGNTIAIDQHRNISRMRSLEFERPMLRATNTGSTAIIDHQGQVLRELPRHTRGALVGEVQGRSGLTPYAQLTALVGLGGFWLLGLAGWAGALVVGRSKSLR